jgi:anti-sigma factor RsiW
VTCDHCKEALAKVIKAERAEREAAEEYRRQSPTPYLDAYLVGTE